MSASDNKKLSQPLVSAIQDAVLFGNIKELDGVLDLVEFEPDFPGELRNNIEALLYFRMNYGKGGDLEPLGPQTRNAAAKLESDWSKKILELASDPAQDEQDKKYA